MDMDGDLDWLLSHRMEKDTAEARKRAAAIFDRISDLSRTELPFSYGLFGGWGSGKTTVLAYLAEMLLEQRKAKQRDLHVVYFNGWKYAGFMEIVPALIYKIIRASTSETDAKTTRKIAQVMLFLGEKHSASIGKWVQDHLFGLNPVELFRDLFAITSKENFNPTFNEVLELYYTQLDRAQDILNDLLPKNSKSVVYVLVDELDRCDPGEAFEVVKQLRIFFAMRRTPLVFVLSVNPDPIGLAIKHQYGLGAAARISDYEAKRILEKFVDSYTDATEPIPLGTFVRDLWSSYSTVEDLSFIAWLDARSTPARYNQDTVKNATLLQTMTTSKYLYSNLRVLKKSMDFSLRNTSVYTNLTWTAWHLDILKQMDMDLRLKLKSISRDLGEIARQAHIDVLRELAASGQIVQNGRIGDNLVWPTDKGHTPFAVYRSFFWERITERIDFLDSHTLSDAEERKAVLKDLSSDPHIMDFIIVLSAVPFRSSPIFRQSSLANCREIEVHELIENWPSIDSFQHFGWILYNISG